MSRLSTADARRVSPQTFFDAITGDSPARREERRRQMREGCKRAIARGDTYGWPPSLVEECRSLMVEDELWTEVHSDPLLKRRVA